jgi:hypothetical protein
MPGLGRLNFSLSCDAICLDHNCHRPHPGAHVELHRAEKVIERRFGPNTVRLYQNALNLNLLANTVVLIETFKLLVLGGRRQQLYTATASHEGYLKTS